MVDTDPEALKQIYRQWPIEKLARALTIERDQYNPDAIPVMRRALESHELSAEQLGALFAKVGAEHGAATERLSRIRGVLLLFIVVVAVTSVMDLFTSLAFAAAPATAPIVLRLFAVPLVIVGLYGLYCSFLLVKRKSRAPQHARRWLVWSFVVGTAAAALNFLIAGDVSLGAAGPAVFALVWLGYLSDSKRVAVVYGSPEESRSGGTPATQRGAAPDGAVTG